MDASSRTCAAISSFAVGELTRCSKPATVKFDLMTYVEFYRCDQHAAPMREQLGFFLGPKDWREVTIEQPPASHRSSAGGL
jgi:hypothetical protein